MNQFSVEQQAELLAARAVLARRMQKTAADPLRANTVEALRASKPDWQPDIRQGTPLAPSLGWGGVGGAGIGAAYGALSSLFSGDPEMRRRLWKRMLHGAVIGGGLGVGAGLSHYGINQLMRDKDFNSYNERVAPEYKQRVQDALSAGKTVDSVPAPVYMNTKAQDPNTPGDITSQLPRGQQLQIDLAVAKSQGKSQVPALAKAVAPNTEALAAMGAGGAAGAYGTHLRNQSLRNRVATAPDNTKAFEQLAKMRDAAVNPKPTNFKATDPLALELAMRRRATSMRPSWMGRLGMTAEEANMMKGSLPVGNKSKALHGILWALAAGGGDAAWQYLRGDAK